MNRIQSPQARRAPGRAALHALLAMAAPLLLVAWAHTAGADSIRLYLDTSHRHYPLLACLMALAAALPNLLLAAQYAAAKRVPAWAGAGAVSVALILCVAIALPLRTQLLRTRPKLPSAPAAHGTRIGPMLQFGPFRGRTAGAAAGVVVWYFDPSPKSGPPEIRYGTDPGPGRMRTASETTGDGKRHEFHLAGLVPSRRYYYRLPGLDDRLRSFVAPPPTGSESPFRFICVADTGNTRRGGDSLSYYGEVMRAAEAWYDGQGTRPGFMIHAGDMVRTGEDLEAWRVHFSSQEWQASLPLVVAPGNHDYLGDRGGNFRYFFRQPDYHTLDYGNARIISLHAYDGPGISLDGPVLSTGREQYRWLKGELARTHGRRWTIVVIHNPILSSGDYGNNELLSAQYLGLFRRHGVDLVVSGHDHNFDLFHADPGADDGGTFFLVAGTGGSHLDSYIMDRPLRRWAGWRHDRFAGEGPYQRDPLTDDYHLYGELSWGFTEVEVRGDTMSVTYFRWLDFERFLSITGQKPGSWDMVGLDGASVRAHGLSRAIPVRTFTKRKGVIP